MTMTTESLPAVLALSEELGADPKRAEFEAWAYVRDYDVTHSKANPLKYANERTQGAYQVWGHLDANWRDGRDRAVAIIRRLLESDVGRQTLHKLEEGQGVDTTDGQAWLRAARSINFGHGLY
jgi:hypothetical protein